MEGGGKGRGGGEREWEVGRGTTFLSNLQKNKSFYLVFREKEQKKNIYIYIYIKIFKYNINLPKVVLW